VLLIQSGFCSNALAKVGKAAQTMAAFRALSAYLNVFDGSLKSWAEFKEKFATVVDKSVVVVTDKGETTYDDWAKAISNFIDDGMVMTILKMELFENGWEQGDVVFYKSRVDFNSSPSITVVCKVMFNSNNMVVRLEPGDPDGFTGGVVRELVAMGKK